MRESLESRRARTRALIRHLDRAYPDAACALHFSTPLELLVATILAAQCTDERVNQVTA
jgi:endonuclease III